MILKNGRDCQRIYSILYLCEVECAIQEQVKNVKH